MADLSVFTRFKGFNDFQNQAQDRELKAALVAAKIGGGAGGGGGNLPAPIQLANEFDKARQAGDLQRMNDIAQFAKIYDRGVAIDQAGSYQPAPNYAQAAGAIAGAKKGMEQQAQKSVDYTMNPLIRGAEVAAELEKRTQLEPPLEGKKTFAKGVAESDVKVLDKTNDAISKLKNLEDSISVAKDLIPRAKMTGPVFGRLGAMAEEPNYRNLQGAINSVTLQAKDLYDLGSGQGFSNTDREFLQEVIAGKYARAEAIGLGLDRMNALVQKRKAFLAKKNKDVQTRNPDVPIANIESPDIPSDEKILPEPIKPKNIKEKDFAARQAGFTPAELSALKKKYGIKE